MDTQSNTTSGSEEKSTKISIANFSLTRNRGKLYVTAMVDGKLQKALMGEDEMRGFYTATNIKRKGSDKPVLIHRVSDKRKNDMKNILIATGIDCTYLQDREEGEIEVTVGLGYGNTRPLLDILFIEGIGRGISMEMEDMITNDMFHNWVAYMGRIIKTLYGVYMGKQKIKVSVVIDLEE